MAKFAPVAPTPILKELKEAGALGDYHLVVAPYVAEEPELYAELYSDIPDCRIILDNGTFEFGVPSEISVIKAAHDTLVSAGASILTALPDYMHDYPRTMTAIRGAILPWYAAGLGPFMAIPQGYILPDFLQCMKEIMQVGKGYTVTSWGIPRLAANRLGSRRELVKWASTLASEWSIHLLGFSDHFKDDMACAQMKEVEGIDSTEPIRLALESLRVNFDNPVSPSGRGDFWEMTTLGDRLDDVIENLDLVREHIGG